MIQSSQEGRELRDFARESIPERLIRSLKIDLQAFKRAGRNRDPLAFAPPAVEANNTTNDSAEGSASSEEDEENAAAQTLVGLSR